MLNRLFLTLFLFSNYSTFANEKIEKLLKSYPDTLEKYENNYIYFKDGTKLIYDDYIEKKTYEELLNSASIKDMLEDDYLSINYDENFKPKVNFNPGRVRNQEFFEKMYGDSKKNIEKNLVKIKWLENSQNRTLLVTKINGVDKKLQEVSKELDKLPKELKKYVLNPSGTYNFRKIKATNRLSLHSFAISIDINLAYSNYWLWNKQSKGKFSYRNSIPKEIVEIFEKYGFIWGGKWYHYDTMHFEYRPELLMD